MTDAGRQEVVDEAMARLVGVMEDVTGPRGLQGRFSKRGVAVGHPFRSALGVGQERRFLAVRG